MPIKKITQVAKIHNKKRFARHRSDFIDGKSIKKMLNKKIINHIAKATGFIQRQRKLDVYEFFFFNLRVVKRRHLEFNRLG